jgi:hypothetical protein
MLNVVIYSTTDTFDSDPLNDQEAFMEVRLQTEI